MPINKKEMSALKKQYGVEKGKKIYYALENKAKSKAKNSQKPKSK